MTTRVRYFFACPAKLHWPSQNHYWLTDHLKYLVQTCNNWLQMLYCPTYVTFLFNTHFIPPHWTQQLILFLHVLLFSSSITVNKIITFWTRYRCRQW